MSQTLSHAWITLAQAKQVYLHTVVTACLGQSLGLVGTQPRDPNLPIGNCVPCSIRRHLAYISLRTPESFLEGGTPSQLGFPQLFFGPVLDQIWWTHWDP